MVKKPAAGLRALSIIKMTYHQFYSGMQPLCDTPLPVHLHTVGSLEPVTHHRW